ncbi:hypothetical protein WJX81_006074 [Elliptochloris bilobata]|uniref:CRAL-TRIO domain-containing protein n=1 Tax=Elliptochloris bilobata TaxID=381761 RepID=A0AAW1RXL9_9CHLO
MIAEWGLTKAQEEVLLEQFKKQLIEAGVYDDTKDMYFLRRFLRARQHDLKKTKDMYAASMKWRREFGVEDVTNNFHFTERDAFIALYPQGYHKTDKLGRPIYIQHLGQINMKKMYEVTTEERMLKFHVQEYERCARYIMPACSIVAGRHIDQTFAIIDLKGVGLKHLTGEVKKMLGKITSIDQNNYPEMMGHTCIINAPGVFKVIWTIIKPMLDPRTQAKIEVLSKDYQKGLLEWIEPANLPDYLGGTSRATLLDDAGPWQDPGIVAEIEAGRARTGGAKHIREEPEGEAASGAGGAAAEVAASPGGYLPPPAVALTRRNSSGSQLGDAEENYYSPRSQTSFSGSFVSAADGLERTGSDDAEPMPSPFAAPPAAAMPPAAGGKPAAGKGGGASSILARVRALEERVPALAAKAGKRAPLPTEPPAATLLSRIEVLEAAVGTLLALQEEQLDQHPAKDAERPAQQRRGCLACLPREEGCLSQFGALNAATPGLWRAAGLRRTNVQRAASMPAPQPAARPREREHNCAVQLEDVRAMWLLVRGGAQLRRQLLIEDLETGDVLMPLVDLKPVFQANYSRKVSALRNRLVVAPSGSELLAARPRGCTLYWKWAFEAPATVKDVIRREIGAENMASGHVRLVLVPIAYNAMAAKEAQRKQPLFVALAAALRRSTYFPLLKHPPPEPVLPGGAAQAAPGMESSIDPDMEEPPLFTGPHNLRATLRKHMEVLSETDKLTDAPGAKRPRSSQGDMARPIMLRDEAAEGQAGASTCEAPSAAWVAELRSKLRADLHRELSRELGTELKRVAQEVAGTRAAYEGQIAELYYDLAAAKSCLMQLYGVILPGRIPEGQPPLQPQAQQRLQPLEHQAAPAGMAHVPSPDAPRIPVEDAAGTLRHAAAAELLSAGDRALGNALHNSLSVDSLASGGAAREGSHDSSNTAGGAMAGLTGALLQHAGGRRGMRGAYAVEAGAAAGEGAANEGALGFLHQLLMQQQVGGGEVSGGALGGLLAAPAGLSGRRRRAGC